jgi:hypothetical protein
VHAEFNRFLNGVIHALATGDSLCKRESQSRLAIDGSEFTQVKKDRIPLDALDARVILPA